MERKVRRGRIGEARLSLARDSHTAGLQQGEEMDERMKHGKEKGKETMMVVKTFLTTLIMTHYDTIS